MLKARAPGDRDRVADALRRDFFMVRRAARSSLSLRQIPTHPLQTVFPGIERTEVTLSHRWRPRGLPHGEALVLSLITAYLQPSAIFEIGTGTGEGTILIAAQAPRAEIHTLDLGENTSSLGERRGDEPIRVTSSVGEAFRDGPHAERIEQHFGDSATFSFDGFAGSMDLVLVDGAHTRKYVVSDSRAALAMVRPGGVVVWDDCHLRHEGVSQGLVEVRRQGHDIVRVAGTRFGVLRA